MVTQTVPKIILKFKNVFVFLPAYSSFMELSYSGVREDNNELDQDKKLQLEPKTLGYKGLENVQQDRIHCISHPNIHW